MKRGAVSDNFDNPYVDALERIQRQDAEIAKANERIAELEAALKSAEQEIRELTRPHITWEEATS